MPGHKSLRWMIAAAAGILLVGIVIWICVRKIDQPGVTAASASRELSLVLADKDEIDAVQSERFAVGERDGWYVPYMEYLYARGLLDTKITAATPKAAAGNLSMEALRRMADGLGIWSNSDVWKNRRVTPEIWSDFLAEVRLRFDHEGAIQTRDLIVYGTAANLNGIGAWEAATEKGVYTFGGFSMDTYLDQWIQVWVRGAEIIRVTDVLSREVTYTNMLITRAQGKSLTVFFAGYMREFALPQTVELYANQIIDLQLTDGEISGIRRKNERIDSRILAVSETAAELEGYGNVPFARDMRIYQLYGNIAMKSPADIVIGYDIYDVIAAEGEICALLIRQSPDARTIRVLLTDRNGAVKVHPEIRLTSRSAFTVTLGQEQMDFAAGEILIADEIGIYKADSLYRGDGGTDEGLRWTLEDGQRLTVRAQCGEITVNSLTRSFGNPTYPGTLEILKEEDGFYLINETLIEDYLCHVLPSEMPTHYNEEALRAQAICARGFAATHLRSSRYQSIGAHVDDTVSFQVYNYAEAEESSTQAVRDTYGEVLTWGGEIAVTYYFSTSCGFTSDISLWGEDPMTSPHLQAKRMGPHAFSGDIRDEETFRAFIMDTGLDDYECNYGWYRWNTTVTLDELTVSVNQRLSALGTALKDRVLTKQEDGTWSEGATGVGRVESVTVLERSAGGIASLVEIVGSEATVRLVLQSAIREVLGSDKYVYHRIDGGTVTNWSSLASAYFCLEPVYADGTLSGYTLYGGGSGHGVGMSQNCANALGQSGVDAETMLKFFYEGTEIAQLYQ